ncbi:MAG: hypothetical protein RQ756_00885 [Flavobacteriaceae bacterium]|nr:hypothetical protein [Flavobacteriaceae bacterium]
MKKSFLFLAFAALAVISCSDDDTGTLPGGGGGGNTEVITKTGIITSNETWTSDNVYVLDGRVVVDEGVTLTIQPGTIIKGEVGQETLASVLIVDQGGRLIADGTASQPIIFTSVLDQIQPGQTQSPNLDEDDAGLWGGVIVLGRAPISVSGDVLTAQIEGIPANEPFGQYGGTDPNDDSGIIRYVSIRHGGITIGQDNEINGLTMGGVGAGTIIDNIEVVANQDDAFEWFGGTVNSSNLIAWAQQDDALDIDQSYSGTITNAIVVQSAASDRALEIDGPEGSLATAASFTMNDVTVFGNAANTFIADFRDGARGALNNIKACGFSDAARIRFNGQNTQDNFSNDLILFDNWRIEQPTGITNLADLLTDAPAGTETKFTANAGFISDCDNSTVGANIAAFGWTLTSQSNAIPGGSGNNTIVKSGILTSNETWTSNNIYVLDGRVVVDENVTLTIEPGTIIKGEVGQETLASALIVDQGGTIIADGAPNNPIIFTSILDNIQVGQTAGTNLTQDDAGLWGGLIVLGRAPISVSGDVMTAQIEGIPANEPFGQYGGNNPNDNSGVIRYVSIRHGGITIGQDNEINGLTMGGVGAGTIIDNVEVVANQDDAFEWFGGTVNSSNLVAWAQQDDGLDIDQSYSGTINNAVVIQSALSDRPFEIDGPEGSLATAAAFTMNNVTMYGASGNTFYADFRDGARGSLSNVKACGFSDAARIRFNGQNSIDNFQNGLITFNSWEIEQPAGITTLDQLLTNPGTAAASFTNNASFIANCGAGTVGANESGFGWTFASSQGAL